MTRKRIRLEAVAYDTQGFPHPRYRYAYTEGCNVVKVGQGAPPLPAGWSWKRKVRRL